MHVINLLDYSFADSLPFCCQSYNDEAVLIMLSTEDSKIMQYYEVLVRGIYAVTIM